MNVCRVVDFLRIVFRHHILLLLSAYLFAVGWTGSYWIPWVTLTVLNLLIYWIHVWTHFFPPWLERWTPHLYHHHAPRAERHKWIDLLQEIVFNVAFAGGILAWLSAKYGWTRWFPPIVCLLYAFTYTSIHLINYGINWPRGCTHYHVLHHVAWLEKRRACNLGPDYMDHIFGTSCDGSFEQMNYYTLNIVIIGTILSYLFGVSPFSLGRTKAAS